MALLQKYCFVLMKAPGIKYCFVLMKTPGKKYCVILIKTPGKKYCNYSDLKERAEQPEERQFHEYTTFYRQL